MRWIVLALPLLAVAACGGGSMARDEANGLRLRVDLPDQPYVAGEWYSATASLINERDSPANVVGTDCSPYFSFWIADKGYSIVDVGEGEKPEFGWYEHWAKTVLGDGTHVCSDQPHVIAPGDSLDEEITFMAPEPGEFEAVAEPLVGEGTSFQGSSPTKLNVRSIVEVVAP